MSMRNDRTTAELEPLVESIETVQAVMFKGRSRGDKIEVVITDNGSDAIPCKVSIEGDSEGDRKKIEKLFLDQGWTCTTDSHDNKKSTCKSPPPK